MELHISKFDATVWIALFLAFCSCIALVCLGLSEKISGKTSFRVSLGVMIVVTIILLPMAFHDTIRKELEARAVQRYTFHPSASTVYDGMRFPAGSTVVEDPDAPHIVINGTVPENTLLLGLFISGDFTIGQPTGNRELIDATLSRPGTIHGVPCAAGSFKIDHDISPTTDVSKINCTLSSDFESDGRKFQSNTSMEMALDRSSVSGTLAAPWKAPAAACAPGHLYYDRTLLECILRHDTEINGYPLAGNHEASIITNGNAAHTFDRATLARPMSLFGVSVPAGSEISSSDEVPSAAKLLAHDLRDYEMVDFHLPESAHFVIEGVDIRGRVRMSFGNNTFGAHNDAMGDNDGVTSLRHDGIDGEHGTYDPQTKKWCWEQACWK